MDVLANLPSLDRLWSDDFFYLPSRETSENLNLYEDEEAVYVEAPLPGLNAEEVEASFDRGVLTVRGKREEEEKEGKTHYRKAKREFYYKVSLPSYVRDRAPEARLKNGMLSLKFLKEEIGGSVRKIDIAT